MQVSPLGQEDPLEEEMAIHSGILAWEIPWTEEPGELQSVGVTKRWIQLSKSTTTTENYFERKYCNIYGGKPEYIPLGLKDFLISNSSLG